ncbi:MAG TPA: dihydrolipoamide acetyltransferase family protein, partial [Conexibacter sp.]|nr:dihydrolipoamide acetyltransferase family protein [Conexibacter sp.]
MAVDVIMPRLSDSMEEGTVLRWLKSAGDPVSVGDELAEIETDKANMTFEAEADGVLLEIVVAEGETAPLGGLLARIGAPEEQPATAPAASLAAADRVGGSEDARPAAEGRTGAHPEGHRPRSGWSGPARSSAGTQPSNGRVSASPVARRLAAQRGVELAGVTGTGPRGRIVKRDVEAAVVAAPVSAVAPAAAAPGATAAAPVPSTGGGGRGEAEVQELSRLQQVIARRMAESKATIPDFALWADVDMSACVALRGQMKAMTEKAPSYNDMIVKAAALALRDFPQANASWRDGAIELHGRVNVGVAVAAD